jgi:hypothetical protein
MDSVNLENDVLGVRLWGPPTQPTLSIGKADIWGLRYPLRIKGGGLRSIRS